MPYIAFVGFFKEVDPKLVSSLNDECPVIINCHETGETDSIGCPIFKEEWTGFREGGLFYSQIDYRDSLTIYLARINEQIGHLVADCPEGGWVEECFVYLDSDGNPIKDDDNWNPNPIPQLLELEQEQLVGISDWEKEALNELNREIDAYIEQEKADHIIDLDAL